MGAYGPGEDDVVEYGGAPPRLPGWARRPQWLPTLEWRPSRAAAILGIVGLIVGLAAGYALAYRQLRQAVLPSRATVAGAVPSAVAGSAGPSDPAAFPEGSGGYSSSLSITGFSGIGLAQTTQACSVQRGRELQVGVEVTNLSGTTIHLGQVRPILPMGGLRLVSQQWAPCGVISQSWQVTIVPSTGKAESGSLTPPDALPGGHALPPLGTAWLSVTFKVLVACPRPLPVRFSVSYQENGSTGTTQLPGLPDLAQVPYTGCTGNS